MTRWILQTDQYQAFWIAKLKADTTIKALFPDIDAMAGGEIREFAWGGKRFIYPNLRVGIDNVEPEGNPDCSDYLITWRTYIYSEKEKSSEVQQLTVQVNEFILNFGDFSVGPTEPQYFQAIGGARLVSYRPSIAYDREGHREWGSESIWQQRVRAKRRIPLLL